MRPEGSIKLSFMNENSYGNYTFSPSQMFVSNNSNKVFV